MLESYCHEKGRGSLSPAEAGLTGEGYSLSVLRTFFLSRELELELIKAHMAQRPVLRVEVGACVARAVSFSLAFKPSQVMNYSPDI